MLRDIVFGAKKELSIVNYQLSIIFITLLVFFPIRTFALSGAEHRADMIRIFPFAEVRENHAVLSLYRHVNTYLDNPYIQPGERPSKDYPKRPKSIADHPKFSLIHWHGKHRIWFHWGFNTDPRHFKPITTSLDKALHDGIISESDLPEFWKLINQEVSQRNRTLMNEAAQVFGFDSLGNISASQRRQINGMVTILYSIHILGDYQTTDSLILMSKERVYADIYNAIDNLAGKLPQNHQKAKELKQRLKPHQSDPKDFLDTLERHFSPFLLSLSGQGYDYKALFRKKGYKLKKNN